MLPRVFLFLGRYRMYSALSCLGMDFVSLELQLSEGDPDPLECFCQFLFLGRDRMYSALSCSGMDLLF